MTKKLTFEELKRRIARLPVNSTGSRLRYPEELKEAAVALAEERKRHGWTQSSVATALGINDAMLSSWKGERRGARLNGGKFRPVSVQDEDSPQEASRALVLPNGVRIEGLNLDELVALVRELT